MITFLLVLLALAGLFALADWISRKSEAKPKLLEAVNPTPEAQAPQAQVPDAQADETEPSPSNSNSN
jgi:hypothetical protein